MLSQLILILGLGLTFAQNGFAEAKSAPIADDSCEAQATAKDDSVQQGILSHGEHWIDLVLAQTSRDKDEHLAAFEEFGNQLIEAAKAGQMKLVNEKIDGSPSIVFGWTAEGKPFVAYKSHFSSAKTQKLVTDFETAQSVFPRSQALKHVFTQLFLAVEPLMKNKRAIREYVFQGDLLFVPDTDRKEIRDDGIHISPNTIDYVIKPEDPLYATIKKAKVGIAIHTVGERTISEDGRLGVKAVSGKDARPLLDKFVKIFNNDDVFMMDPLRDNVSLGQKLNENEIKSAVELNAEIRKDIQSLSAEFHQLAKTYFEAELRVFFNSQVRPPNDGGVFKSIFLGAEVDPAVVAMDFGAWLKDRKIKTPFKAFEAMTPELRTDLVKAIRAYLNAIRLQNLLLPHLEPAMRSKLGGGMVEGLILVTDKSIVKFVDRLGFTMQNNLKRGIPAAPAPAENPFANYPAPFNEWHDGKAFLLMKGQPIHKGHLEMIRLAQTQLGRVHILASNKGPNLNAKKLSELGAAASAKEMKERKYTHVFSNELRQRVIKAGLGESEDVHMMFTGLLWSYLETAVRFKIPGKVKLVVGQKEVDEGRYDEQLEKFKDHLELYPVPLQHDGLSATMIRKLIMDAALGSLEAREQLREAYAFIASDIERENLIRDMIQEWQTLDEKAQSLIPKKKPKKKKTPKKKKAS